MGRLTGKVAIITGANSGIGKATAQLFAKEGAAVVLAARRLEKLKEVEEAILADGGKALSVSCDVSNYDECLKLADAAYEAFGKIDILVNNAGIADKHRPITRCEPDLWEEVIRVDQTSLYYMTKAALRYMEPAKSGSIVNISSIGGTRGTSGVAYSSAKAAIIGMTKNVALQFAPVGIRCNAVAPGPTPTAFNTPEQIATFDGEFAGQCNSHMNMNLPESRDLDQAYAILFFASDESVAVTGQILTVDHGTTI